MHPAVQEARDLIREEEAERRHPTAALERAVMLAPTITVCEALLRGEAVPFSKLDGLYFRRYGIRRAS